MPLRRRGASRRPEGEDPHLAVALGVRAVERGLSVAFFRLEDLLHALKKDAEVPPRRLRSKKYMNVALLVIDEVGFQPLSRQVQCSARARGAWGTA